MFLLTTACFLDRKIPEHRHMFLEVFPRERLISKYFYGAPAKAPKSFCVQYLWTMCSEAKQFSKQSVVTCSKASVDECMPSNCPVKLPRILTVLKDVKEKKIHYTIHYTKLLKVFMSFEL